MRPRAVLGVGALLVLLVAAVVTLRVGGPGRVAPDSASPARVLRPRPVADARADRLTTTFLTTAVLPMTVRLAGDGGASGDAGGSGVGGVGGRFRFLRYADDTPGGAGWSYQAGGYLVRQADNATLDEIRIVLLPSPPGVPTAPARCDPTAGAGGQSCTARSFPDGTRATVVRNAVFAQAVASDSTSGSPPGTETVLRAVLPRGSRLTVVVTAIGTAGIPLDDAGMLRFAALPDLES